MNPTKYIIRCISKTPFSHHPANPVKKTERGYETIFHNAGIENKLNDLNTAYLFVAGQAKFFTTIQYEVEESDIDS